MNYLLGHAMVLGVLYSVADVSESGAVSFASIDAIRRRFSLWLLRLDRNSTQPPAFRQSSGGIVFIVFVAEDTRLGVLERKFCHEQVRESAQANIRKRHKPDIITNAKDGGKGGKLYLDFGF